MNMPNTPHDCEVLLSASGLTMNLRKSKVWERGCVFRMKVTGRFGIVTGDFGNVTGRFGNVTERTARQNWRCA
jgi:hypothetical protein